MPVDLFEQEGIDPKAPVDLFEQEGISVPKKNKVPAWQAALTGLETGFENLAHGALQPILESGLLGNTAKEASKIMASERNRRYKEAAEEHPFLSGAGNIAGTLVGGAPFTLIPGIGQAGLVRGITQGALQGGALGATEYAPDLQERLKNAAIGAPAGAVGGAVAEGINALRPSVRFRGQMTPEELKEAQRVTAGTETPLGDVIQSPWLKRLYENTLTKLPFTGAYDALQRNKTNIEEQGKGILGKLLGNNTEQNVPAQLVENLKANYKAATQEKSKIYEKANKIANKSKFIMDTRNFEKAVSDLKNSIESTNVIKADPDLARLLGRLGRLEGLTKEERNIGNIVDTKGKPIIDEIILNPPSLQEAGILKGMLGAYSRELSHSPTIGDRKAAKSFGKLAAILSEDIKNSIRNSGSKTLKKTWIEAEKNYKENFSPFLQEDIFKYANEGTKVDTDLITQAFVRTGPKTDRANLINKLMGRLSEDKQGLLGYDYLTSGLKGSDQFNPLKIAKAFKNLGSRQKEALFPQKSTRDALENYSKLVDMNKESFATMFNPHTGQRGVEGILKILGAVTGGITGTAAGAPGTIAGTIAGSLAPGIALRGVTKKLTSEEYRDKLIKAMLAKRKESKLPFVTGATAAALGSE